MQGGRGRERGGWGWGERAMYSYHVRMIDFLLLLYTCRCGLMECGRKLLNALPDIGEGEEEGSDEYWVSVRHM